jgi:hypothetical protein
MGAGCENSGKFRNYFFCGKKVLPGNGLTGSVAAFTIRAVIGTGLERDQVNAQ